MIKHCFCVLLFGSVLSFVTSGLAYSENESFNKDLLESIKNPTFKYLPENDKRNDFYSTKIKSVPTLGKRNDFFFAKNLKSVPRIGRRNDFFMKTASKSLPRIGRRGIAPAWMETEGVSVWPWLRDDSGLMYMKRAGHFFHDEDDFLKHLDLNKEILETRLQPVVHEY